MALVTILCSSRYSVAESISFIETAPSDIAVAKKTRRLFSKLALLIFFPYCIALRDFPLFSGNMYYVVRDSSIRIYNI